MSYVAQKHLHPNGSPRQWGGGDGLLLHPSAQAVVEHSLIAGNSRHGCSLSHEAELRLRFSTIAQNGEFGISTEGSSLSLIGSVVARNLSGSIAGDPAPALTAVGSLLEREEFPGVGNLSSPPRFLSPGVYRFDRFTGDPQQNGLPNFVVSLGDYRLDRGSPGWNAGPDTAVLDGERDLAGEPRIACGQVDMGAYENQECRDPVFRRGDAQGDGRTTVADAIAILLALFRSGAIACESAADVNDDGVLDVADPVRLLFWLFAGAADPTPPFAECGADPTPDRLSCRTSPACE
jgi:hypothetical protein